MAPPLPEVRLSIGVTGHRTAHPSYAPHASRIEPALRIALVLKAPEAALDYDTVAALAHAADEIVVDEIENWQSVFEAKQITVPA